MRKLTDFEFKLWCKFKIPGGNNLQRIKVSQVFLSAANTWEHEIQKVKMAYDCLVANEKFIMEAVEIANNRRRDFVNLTTGIAYEWERDKARYEQKLKEKAYESPNCVVEVIKLYK